LTKLEEKQNNMQIGYKQMSERISYLEETVNVVGYLEETVFDLHRKVKTAQQKDKTVRKKQ
jgi:hypothetical protein